MEVVVMVMVALKSHRNVRMGLERTPLLFLRMRKI